MVLSAIDLAVFREAGRTAGQGLVAGGTADTRLVVGLGLDLEVLVRLLFKWLFF